MPTRAQTQRNHSHLKKEALVVVSGVQKFHEYCFRHLFTSQADEKPLLGITGDHKDISITSAASIWR